MLRPSPLTVPPLLLLGVVFSGTACIGGRFKTANAAAEVDRPTQALVDRLAAERARRGLPAPNWVDELRPPAARAGLAVSRGDQSLKTAAHRAALGAVTELGRHVWSFAAECTDLERFRPPPMALEQKTLLLGAAAVPVPGGHQVVFLLVADPGPSALRADQMGGGNGGSNPTLESYAHPTIASGPCGETWPAPAHAPL